MKEHAEGAGVQDDITDLLGSIVGMRASDKVRIDSELKVRQYEKERS